MFLLSCSSPPPPPPQVVAQQGRLFTPPAHQFVRRTLALEPQQRPTAAQLLTADAFIKVAKKANTQGQGLLAVIHAAELNAAAAERGGR